MTWPLYRKYGHAFEAFKLIGQDPNSVLGELTKTVTRKTDAGEVTETVPAVTPEMREAFVVNIRRRMTPTPLKIRADVELTCFAYDGVLHIKARRAARVRATRFSPRAMRASPCTPGSPAGLELRERLLKVASPCVPPTTHRRRQ